MRKLVLFLSSFVISFQCLSESIPILNISWDTPEPKSGVRNQEKDGYNIYIIEDMDDKIFFQATGYFKDGKLTYIKLKSRSVYDDAGMEKIVSLYKGEKKKLSKEFEKTISHEYILLRNRYGIVDPLTCLNYLDCGKYNTYFKGNKGESIRLEIKPVSKSESYLELSLQKDNY